MSQRERPASRGGPASGYPPAAPRPGDPPDGTVRAPSWDELFTLLPADQRDRLLILAADRGALDAGQVPEPPPAAHTRRLGEQSRRRADAQLAETAERCRRRETDGCVFDRLVELADQCQRLDARRSELAAHRARVPDEAAAALAASPAAADHA